jgi:hypothetical protein
MRAARVQGNGVILADRDTYNFEWTHTPNSELFVNKKLPNAFLSHICPFLVEKKKRLLLQGENEYALSLPDDLSSILAVSALHEMQRKVYTHTGPARS